MESPSATMTAKSSDPPHATMTATLDSTSAGPHPTVSPKPTILGEENAAQKADLNNFEDSWGLCLIGYVVGRFPGLKAIEEVRRSWNIHHRFFIHESGWMVFEFEKKEDRERVIMEEPYKTNGITWFLKEMPPSFKFGDECFTKIPTWIKYPSLPLQCWSRVVLSKITSVVGTPICMDKVTDLRLRLNYARVLVEVDVTKPLRREVSFILPNGKVMHQEVIYEHEPKLCKTCRMIVHNEEKCKGKKEKGRGKSKSRARKAGQPVKNVEVENKLEKNEGKLEEQAGKLERAIPAEKAREPVSNQGNAEKGGETEKEKLEEKEGREQPLEEQRMEMLKSASNGKENEATGSIHSSAWDFSDWHKLFEPPESNSKGEMPSFIKGIASEEELEAMGSTSKMKSKKKKKKGKKGGRARRPQ